MSADIWNNPPRGFRMMLQDPPAIMACLAFVVLAWPTIGEWSLVAPFVLGNFFLFCNVFRIGGARELVWSAAFLANSTCWLWVQPSLAGIFLTQMPVTIAVIAHSIQSPSYHGVLASRLSAPR